RNIPAPDRNIFAPWTQVLLEAAIHVDESALMPTPAGIRPSVTPPPARPTSSTSLRPPPRATNAPSPRPPQPPPRRSPVLPLIAVDDGYEPSRTVEAMKQLVEKDHVAGVIGNVGTPTAAVAAPYAVDHKVLFFGPFTGAPLLRKDPPDRYVFNYRASYAEETA